MISVNVNVWLLNVPRWSHILLENDIRVAAVIAEGVRRLLAPEDDVNVAGDELGDLLAF